MFRMTFRDFKEALLSANIRPGRRISLDEYQCIVNGVPENLRAFAMDCFIPEGEAIEPGYEDSLEWYTLGGTWEELQKDWEDSFFPHGGDERRRPTKKGQSW